MSKAARDRIANWNAPRETWTLRVAVDILSIEERLAKLEARDEPSEPASERRGVDTPDVWSRLECEIVWEADVAELIREAVAVGRFLSRKLAEVEAERDKLAKDVREHEQVIEELTRQRHGGAA